MSFTDIKRSLSNPSKVSKTNKINLCTIPLTSLGTLFGFHWFFFFPLMSFVLFSLLQDPIQVSTFHLVVMFYGILFPWLSSVSRRCLGFHKQLQVDPITFQDCADFDLLIYLSR